MWQTDTVIFLEATTVDVYGAKQKTWSAFDPTRTVLCDVQDITKEKVQEQWGFTDGNVWKQVFDHTQSTEWVEGNQVQYDGTNYIVKKIDGNMGKMGASNHTFVLLKDAI